MNTRIHQRAKGSTTVNVPEAPGTVIRFADYADFVMGWFRNSRNVGGWVIVEPNAYDVEWIESNEIDSSNVFRTFAFGTGISNLVRINFETGTYAFADHEHEGETDRLKFQRAEKFTVMFLDNL